MFFFFLSIKDSDFIQKGEMNSENIFPSFWFLGGQRDEAQRRPQSYLVIGFWS